MYRRLGTAAVLSLVLASPLTLATGTAAHAAPAPVPAVHPIEKIKKDVVQQLIAAKPDGTTLTTALAKGGNVDLTTLLAGKGAAGDRFTRFVRAADQQIKDLKGLSRMRGSALSIRLANPEKRGGLLLAASSSADETSSTVVAHDLRGRAHVLDARVRPTVPVAVVELDTEKVVPAAVEALTAQLAAAGVSSDAPTAKVGTAASKIVTVLDRIWVDSDEEPWISGRAEFYGMALGQGMAGEPRVDLVQMPYLDYDHTTYYPNQIVVDWSHYRWNAVDFMLMEHDDNSNYRDIAVVIANAIAPFTGQYAQYVQLVAAVLSALPASWFTNDDDYADSLYFMTRDTRGDRVGAGNNARVGLSRHVVTE